MRDAAEPGMARGVPSARRAEDQGHAAECGCGGLSPPPSWLGCALAYIHTCWRDNFTIADLARVVQVSQFHLIRIFGQHVGVPPSAYRRALRIRVAQRLLRAGWPAGDVAAECGFYDQSHLTRHLKAFTGLTPLQYARRHTEASRASNQPGPEHPAG
jgi:AraC-like DNA-binding protein